MWRKQKNDFLLGKIGWVVCDTAIKSRGVWKFSPENVLEFDSPRWHLEHFLTRKGTIQEGGNYSINSMSNIFSGGTGRVCRSVCKI